jgi:lysozyme
VTITDTFGLPVLTAELTADEGRRSIPYFDSRHILSAGVGRNLGKGFSVDEIDLLFSNDVAGACRDLDLNTLWWRALPEAKQRVMIGLCFNMGWPVFSQFHKFLAAMNTKNWSAAAAELQDSLWFHQVGDRGPRVVARLLAPDAASGAPGGHGR